VIAFDPIIAENVEMEEQSVPIIPFSPA